MSSVWGSKSPAGTHIHRQHSKETQIPAVASRKKFPDSLNFVHEESGGRAGVNLRDVKERLKEHERRLEGKMNKTLGPSLCQRGGEGREKSVTAANKP